MAKSMADIMRFKDTKSDSLVEVESAEIAQVSDEITLEKLLELNVDNQLKSFDYLNEIKIILKEFYGLLTNGMNMYTSNDICVYRKYTNRFITDFMMKLLERKGFVCSYDNYCSLNIFLPVGKIQKIALEKLSSEGEISSPKSDVISEKFRNLDEVTDDLIGFSSSLIEPELKELYIEAERIITQIKASLTENSYTSFKLFNDADSSKRSFVFEGKYTLEHCYILRRILRSKKFITDISQTYTQGDVEYATLKVGLTEQQYIDYVFGEKEEDSQSLTLSL